MHHEINEHSLLEYLEEKPECLSYWRKNLLSILKKKVHQELQKAWWWLFWVHILAEICQPHQHARVMPAESRSLLWEKCHLLLSILIIADCPLFWVNYCKPNFWQDKMTSAETGGIMFQTPSPTQCLHANDSNHLYTVNSAIAAPGSTTLSPTHQYSRYSNRGCHTDGCKAGLLFFIGKWGWKGMLYLEISKT